MRVVLLNQYYAPAEAATAQFLADVGAGLAGAGHEVQAICSDRSYADPRRRYPRREVVQGVGVRRVRTTGFGRTGKAGRLADYASYLLGACLALLTTERPGVVLCLSTPPMVAAAGLLAARLKRARFVFWVMDVYPELAFELGVLKPRSLAGRLLARLSRATLAGSDRVVALGETMAQRLEANTRRPVSVIHNWADEETIRPRPVAGHALRREWGWEGRFVVLYSGNLGLAHDFETVIDAAERLRGRPTVLFAFVGGGPRLDELREEVRRRGLGSVEFRPYVPHERLGESLTAGDVHLVTLKESLPGLLVPSKIYGVLAAGRPTLYVGPARGEISDILLQGECGARIGNGDGAALARAICAYQDDAARREEEGRRARRLFEQRFTRSSGVGAFRRLVQELGGNAGGGTPRELPAAGAAAAQQRRTPG